MKHQIICTMTDEAPMLAAHSLLPIVRAFSGAAGIDVKTRDISLAGRILAAFADFLPEEQRVPDGLAELGRLVRLKEANIIKMPNISASIPQIQAAVKEIQAAGFAVPDFPENPDTPEEREIRRRYEKVKGSAVNPVLREGNSDRRSAAAVKRHAQKHPHAMGEWRPDSQTHVASMDAGDFYSSEKSCVLDKADTFRIEFRGTDAAAQLLREAAPLEEGEILDAAVMSRRALRRFLKAQMADTRSRGLLFSLHLKATMMKVSDPVIFGDAIRVLLDDFFRTHGRVLESLGVNPDLGLGDLRARLESMENGREKDELLASLEAALKAGPDLAMVDSARGITGLDVPSDVIIDASMPAAFKAGGKMWGPEGTLRDMKAVIPDRSYAGVYQAVVDFCRENGAFNPAAMGSVANVGLMARKAEEYGSHDKTFLAPGDGVIRAVSSGGRVLLELPVENGDIFRMCQTKENAVRDWVHLAVDRARLSGTPAIFWLDEKRAHDRMLAEKVRAALAEYGEAAGPEEPGEHGVPAGPGEPGGRADISIASPQEACRITLQRCREGKDTISVSGNVLRDYLTDLFPILELGTSARMLSIVPLLSGGCLFETGAGGSAPKHVQQLLKENHLRWDSLGEFLALGASYEFLAGSAGCAPAAVLAAALEEATGRLLEGGHSPSRKCGEPDNRSSHFYLALYWAKALAAQNENENLKKRFTAVAASLEENREAIISRMLEVQGAAADIGGYYLPDRMKMEQVMRPSRIFNAIIDGLQAGSPKVP